MADDYETYSLPKLLDFIKNLGQPATLQTAKANWEGIAAELIRRIGLSTADAATLNGLVAAVGAHWRGTGADAYGQHVNDLSNYGVDVADRAYLTNYGTPSSNFATFHSAAGDAMTVLADVKQQAAQIVPLTDDNAKSAYLNSLSPPDRAAVEMPSRFPNPAREQAIQQAVTTYQTSYNEALRRQALQLLNVLGAAYTSIADNLPTKAMGNPPDPHNTSTAVSASGVHLGSGLGGPTALAGQVPTAQLIGGPGLGGQTTSGPVPAGQLPAAAPLTAHAAVGSPAVGANGLASSVPSSLSSVPGTHPLVASASPNLPAGTLPASFDPTTQLASFTPSGAGGGLGPGLAGTGLAPFGVVPTGTAPGIPNLPGLSGLSGAGVAGGGPGGPPAGELIPGAAPAGMLPGGLAAAGLGSGAAGLGRVGAGLRSGAGGLDLPGSEGTGAIGSGLAADQAVAGRVAAGQGAAATANEAAAERAAATGAGLAGREAATGGGMPMMPYLPMSPMAGQGADGVERHRWLDEDEDVWRDDTDRLAPPVIGRVG